MPNTAIYTGKSFWQPQNLEHHKSDNGVLTGYHDEPDLTFEYKSSVNPTHGNIESWPNYGISDMTYAWKDGTKIHNKTRDSGPKFEGGKSGSPHTSNFYLKSKNWWMPSGFDNGIVGAGFEVYRHRLDSTSNNDNANQHCWYIQKWGVVFKHRTDDSERIWSSNFVKEGGAFDGEKVHDYHYYYAYFPDSVMGPDWLVGGIILQTATRDKSTAGNATSYLRVYNLRYYYSFAGPGKNARVVRPLRRSYEDRNLISYA